MATEFSSHQAFLASSALLDADPVSWDDDATDEIAEFLSAKRRRRRGRQAIIPLDNHPVLLSPYTTADELLVAAFKDEAQDLLTIAVEKLTSAISESVGWVHADADQSDYWSQEQVALPVHHGKRHAHSAVFRYDVDWGAAHQGRHQAEPTATRGHSEFVPSPAVTTFWQDGLRAFMRLSASHGNEQGDLLTEGDITHEKLSQEFARRFRGLLASLGHRQRHGLEDNRVLFKAGRFEVFFQLQLLETVQIIPDETGEFLTALYQEISNYLTNGGQLSGRWGQVIKRGDDLYLEAEAQQPQSNLGEWKKATVVE